MSYEALHFRVRSSSSDEIYEIAATFVPTLKITCTCQAGHMGQACKHRMALLVEDVSSVVDVKPEDLKLLATRAKVSPLGIAMQDMATLEREADSIRKKIGAQKKRIARLLNGEQPTNVGYIARY